MSPLSLRAAAPHDLRAIVDLYDEVWRWLAAAGNGPQWGDVAPGEDEGFFNRMAVWVAERAVTLAERDGAVVGVLAFGSRRPPYVPASEIPDRALYLYSVATRRGEPGEGAGELLMGHAARVASDTGVPIALDHWAGSPRLAELYEAYGYEEVARFDDGVLRVKEAVT